ncbi:MAG: RNA polymerase sigma factor [Nannocystales bacterium]
MNNTADDLERAVSGDSGALAQLVRAHRGPLHRYALRVCGSSADAEDATQAGLEKIVRDPSQIRDARKLRPWLFTVARNYCLRLARHAWRWAVVPQTEVPTEDTLSPEDAELVRRLLHAIAALDPTDREVLIRRDVLGERGADVAREMGVSLQSMKSRLHRARKRLARQVG